MLKIENGVAFGWSSAIRGMRNSLKSKEYWWQMIQLLPSSYNQRRTVLVSYEVLAAIYKDRRDHRLDEWHTLCDWIEKLPCADGVLVFREK